MRKWLMLACALTGVWSAEAQISTLIVTGQDGSHWWKGGSEKLEEILESDGMFEVGEWAIGFEQAAERLEGYELVVVNWGGEAPSEEARRKFEQWVADGGGVVVVHSSIVPMADWKEWNKMTGLGAWDLRSEKDGPWVYWEDGRVVYDYTPGWAGHHALQHPFTVTHRLPDHPILKGLPEEWEHVKDELYGKARGPAKNMVVLATAWDDPAVGGSGRHEPMLWTVDYGHGRVFVTAMGHAGNDPDMRYSMEDAGFQTTLLRGAEWAATGEVTQETTF